ncbi:magnesium transporter MRS2-3-like [Hibiscus syriacus]|uniref:magnesium transporter MRS2-3-like n=1 Tax=Hibiscus syriacus TaxID=106335 RepID=UPI001922670E|nr:magnesium transporter MRS2-3-like [Hibiscus syriacus]
MTSRPTSSPPKPDDDPDLYSRPVLFPNQAQATATVAGHWKKGTGIRALLILDSTCHTQIVEARKHAIMRLTGLPARDLGILDPLLSYPSTILGRERAIVINLEHIKAIITAQEVLLSNSKDLSEAAVDDSNYIIRSSSQNLSSRFSQPQNLDDEGKSEEKQSLENPNSFKILPFLFVALEAKTLELEAHPA